MFVTINSNDLNVEMLGPEGAPLLNSAPRRRGHRLAGGGGPPLTTASQALRLESDVM
jgi:hypothetical protein